MASGGDELNDRPGRVWQLALAPRHRQRFLQVAELIVDMNVAHLRKVEQAAEVPGLGDELLEGRKHDLDLQRDVGGRNTVLTVDVCRGAGRCGLTDRDDDRCEVRRVDVAVAIRVSLHDRRRSRLRKPDDGRGQEHTDGAHGTEL